MASKWGVLAVLCGIAVFVVVACSGEPYSATCGAGQDCSPGQEASAVYPTCAGGSCSCIKTGEVPCCPSGDRNCPYEMLRCVPAAACVEPPPECTSDDDCPGPPDARCGVGVCVEGACWLEIWFGEAVPNQYPGDCKITMCSIFGEAEVVEDPSDFPDDGNFCTADTCEGDTPVNTVLSDKQACPDHPFGLCSKGKCVECSALLGSYHCPENTVCWYQRCVPPVCVNGKKDVDVGETMTDCGGPYCRTCFTGGACAKGSDCEYGVCQGGKCQAATHSDGVKNADETGIDCGYPGGPPNSCKDGDGCLAATDCESAVCYKGLCQVPTCTDATKNGTETGVDCGGGCSSCQN